MKNRLIAAVLASTFLSACVIETDVTLFASDILAVAGGAPPIKTNVTIAIEVGSKDNCEKQRDATAVALKKGFDDVEFVGCRDGAVFSHFADFRVSLPIQAVQTDINGAAAIWVAEETGLINVVLIPNASKIAAIRDALPPNLNSPIYPEPTMAVKVTVQNDTSGPTIVRMFGAFIDGEPFQLPHDTSLDRRGELAISLSDVGNATLMKGGSLLMILKK